jgi:hypothetical protein
MTVRRRPAASGTAGGYAATGTATTDQAEEAR